MKVHHIYSLFLVLGLLCSCGSGDIENIGSVPPVQPDYVGVTVPQNIAPLHFRLDPEAGYSAPKAQFEAGDVCYTIRQRHGYFGLSLSKWKKLAAASPGSGIKVTVQAEINGKHIEFLPFTIYVSPDRIDPYIAYRLIEPGYEIWNAMGIYQRCLENFDESPVITNNQTDHGCVNCHSFNDYDPDNMLFHARVSYGGTYLVRDGNIEKLNTKTPNTISALVYPQWSRDGRFIAFSVNDTKQMFHTSDLNRIEVFDYKSDIVVYDVEKHEVFSCPQLKAAGQFETFPTFTPDGRGIYFCTADSLSMPENFDKVRYSLCRIGFDPDTRSFSEQVDTLVNARETCSSVSFPRVSPDGRFLMFTMAAYGNFSIWHNDADLYLYDLDRNSYCRLDGLNSDYVDSYHSWSSNGKWVIFSSRRLDGLYTRLFIAHMDEDGSVGKPFVLPQKSPSFYDSFMKSYNIPEFIDGKVRLGQRDLHKVAKDSPGTDIKYVE